MKQIGVATLAILLLACAAWAQTIPAGTEITVTMPDSLANPGTSKAKPGDSWRGTLDKDLLVNGVVVEQEGATVQGTVTEVKKGDGDKIGSMMKVRLLQVGKYKLTSKQKEIPNLCPPRFERTCVVKGLHVSFTVE